METLKSDLKQIAESLDKLSESLEREQLCKKNRISQEIIIVEKKNYDMYRLASKLPECYDCKLYFTYGLQDYCLIPQEEKPKV